MKWLKANFYLLGLFILIFIFFYPVWLKGLIPIPTDTIVGLYHPFRDSLASIFPNGAPYKNYLLTDPVRQLYLYKQLAIQQLALGKLPLWNPYAFSGTPLLAGFQAGVFYPLNLIFFLLPFVNAWTLFIILQPFLGAWFFYVFVRNLKLQSLAATLGALSFIFGGFFMVWLEWGNLGHIILWLPLLLLSIDKIIVRQKPWRLIFTLALVSQFFAGHLQTSFYVTFLTLAYTIYKVAQSKNKKYFTSLFLISYSLFLIITAIQWLPTFQFIRLSARSFDQVQTYTRPDWFLPFKHLIQLIAPDFFGNPATLNYWGVWNYSEFVSFIGIVPLIFAIYAFLHLKQKPFKFFATSALLSLLFALPNPISKLPFILKLPFISQAQPSRLLSVFCFSLSVLSALGFHQYLKKPTKKPLYISLCLVVIIGIFWFSTLKYVSPENMLVAQRNLILPSAILVSAVMLFIIGLNKKYIILVSYVLFLVSCFDLLRFGFKYTPFSSKDFLFPQTQIIKYLQSDSDIFRIISTDRRILPPNFPMAFNLQTIEGYDPLYLFSYAQLITQLETNQNQTQPMAFNRIIKPANLNSDLINQLNVKYVLSFEKLPSDQFQFILQEGQTLLYQNLEALPRARLINGQGSVSITDYQPYQVSLSVNAQTEATLELADMAYPFWQATVDTQATAITASEHNFRQIQIPKGIHQVKFFTKLR